VNDALRNRETPLDISASGRKVGTLIVHNDQQERFVRWRTEFAATGAALLLLLFGLGVGYLLYLNRMILQPFRRMQRFARHVARGELDVPLDMDRNHLFGAFTESFDMMREELAAARHREYLANKSKQELVAGLSHDIKTPVASIKAIAELMLLGAGSGKTGRQLEAVYAKADQIDRLVTDMFHSTLEELNELQVRITEEHSSVLLDMIEGADYSGVAAPAPVPACMIAVDTLRLQQVVDNVMHNARKYAGTAVTIGFILREGYLEAEFADQGPGVPMDELPLIFQKYYRGSRAAGEDGAGLGLYLSRLLMRRMNGEITAISRPDGLTVRLLIPLAGNDLRNR
jgi:signal transduction histidine kinase